MAIETLLAIWGAVLSTVLASLKILEIRREWPRVTTSYSMSDAEHGGNEVIIENASKTPIMISYWELLLQKRKFLRRETLNGRFPDEGYCNITIAAHSRHTLHFKDQQSFPWGQSTLDGSVWYLKLHIVGRSKPICLKVYPKD